MLKIYIFVLVASKINAGGDVKLMIFSSDHNSYTHKKYIKAIESTIDTDHHNDRRWGILD